MLSSQVKFSAQMDRQTDRQTDTGKTICPRSIDAGTSKQNLTSLQTTALTLAKTSPSFYVSTVQVF